ncbi:hypothetical protein [Phycicoccus jejuensis]|uniref:hypothetical protein n=1 Tax=Phycicoccus jejuensis TaxID=367299 RepID=UPI000A9FD648|nr:hypothetical protein [Phycicoccus jejuensis]
MPILAGPPPRVPLTQEVIDAVMAEQRAHCAPSSWDRFVKSLSANRFPFKVDPQ